LVLTSNSNGGSMKKIILAGLLAASCNAQAALTVTDCVIREPAPGVMMTAAYLTIDYTIDDEVKALRLPSNEAVLGASVDELSHSIEVHKTTMKDGVMKMQRLPKYFLKEGSNIMQKGGVHIMIKNLTKQPKAGEAYPLRLWMTYQADLQCNAVVKTTAELNR